MIVKEGLAGDAVGRVAGGLLLGVNQGYALGGGHPANGLVETRIGAEPERVQVAGEEEIGGSGICLTDGQLANGLPKDQLGKLRVNLAGLLVGGQGVREPAFILGLSPAAKALCPIRRVGRRLSPGDAAKRTVASP